MNRLDFDCPFDLAETITLLLDEIEDDAYPVISVYGKYDVIKDILEDLIMSGISIEREIELHDYDTKGYNKEFVLYLTSNGVSVEKIYNDDTYYLSGGNISFVHEDCNSKLLNHIDSKTIYEFSIDEDDECECECSECACKKDEKPTTSTTSKSATYKINNKEVSKEEFDKEFEKFEEMYLDNIRDMLLNYYSL